MSRSMQTQTRSRRPTTSRQGKNGKSTRLTARTADKHDLYQRSVQAPQYEIRFLNKVYKAHTGRKPLLLREDFCGTALLCAEWVKSDQERRAVGLDIDVPTLTWGTEHNLAPLGEKAARVKLLPQDVCVPTREKFEAICAYNYSYSIFHTRDAMRRYFKAVHRSLRDDGIFTLDAIGGWEAQQVITEKRAVDGGFTYVWEQAEYDPITSHFVCHISFEFRDKTKLLRAFTYDWRLWTLQELRELLIEAGFAEVDAYWEGEDKNGEGTGNFHRVTSTTNDPGWNAYLVAKKNLKV
jgi:SAM-dependent methyltransferase